MESSTKRRAEADRLDRERDPVAVRSTRASVIRGVVASVASRSIAGTPETLPVSALNLTEDQRREIDWQVGVVFGIDLRDQDWSIYTTVANLVDHVEMLLERGSAG